MSDSLMMYINKRDDIQGRLKKLLCEKLQLPQKPEDIDPDAPLFGTGLDLDSIDAVEIVMVVESEFGVRLRSIIERKSMRTVNTLTDAILKSEASYAQ